MAHPTTVSSPRRPDGPPPPAPSPVVWYPGCVRRFTPGPVPFPSRVPSRKTLARPLKNPALLRQKRNHPFPSIARPVPLVGLPLENTTTPRHSVAPPFPFVAPPLKNAGPPFAIVPPHFPFVGLPFFSIAKPFHSFGKHFGIVGIHFHFVAPPFHFVPRPFQKSGRFSRNIASPFPSGSARCAENAPLSVVATTRARTAAMSSASVSLSPRGTSGERAGERGIPDQTALLSPALSFRRGRRGGRRSWCGRHELSQRLIRPLSVRSTANQPTMT